MTQNKRILVTGGSGFLGSHLCARLLDAGHDVLCVDNYFTGRKENIRHLLPHPCFEVLRHDVTFPLYVEVDEIYNLACPASPIHYQHDPVQTTKTSVHGAINMLGLAKRIKAKIMQASTSEVYGDPSVHPQTEDYWGNVNPIGPRACYDEGKRCAETLFFDYHRQHRLRIKVARIFNTYGPNMAQNDGRVVSNFIVQALQNQDITVYGEGQQTRSFCYVDDLVEGFIRLMNTPDEFTGPMNLGNLDVDMLSLSGHKLHAPKGVGALYVRRKLPFRPFLIGGHQEHGRRAGTENTTGVIALGAAARAAKAHIPAENTQVRALRDRLENALLAAVPESRLNGHKTERLPNTSNISFKYIEGEAILLLLDQLGIAASSGSACTSGSLEPSHVLRAMGVPFTYAHGSIRFSLSRYTTDADVDYVIQNVPGIIETLRTISPYKQGTLDPLDPKAKRECGS